MKTTSIVKGLAAALACFGMVLPQHAMAAPPAPQPQSQTQTQSPLPPAHASLVVTDVALAEGGVLVGQAVTAEGTPLVRTPVSIQSQGREIATTTTDANGAFAVQGLRGGVHTVTAGGNASTFRLWAPNTAPPVAQQGALIVAGDNVVRGALGDGSFLGNPLVLALLIATAIAVPIAVANRNRSKKKAS